MHSIIFFGVRKKNIMYFYRLMMEIVFTFKLKAVDRAIFENTKGVGKLHEDYCFPFAQQRHWSFPSLFSYK